MILDDIMSALGLSTPAAGGQQQQHSYFDQLFSHWPKARANPWLAGEPHSEEFWAVVKANEKADLTGPAAQAAVAGSTPPAPLNYRGTWTVRNQDWLAMPAHEQAAMMAMFETGGNPDAARKALATMYNRSIQERRHIGGLVSSKMYQPSMESKYIPRLREYRNSPVFRELTEWGARYGQGKEADPTNGATHFIVPESTMTKVVARRQQTHGDSASYYRDWLTNTATGRHWTGYDAREARPAYKNVTARDAMHVYLAPNGRVLPPTRTPDPFER